MKEPFEPSTKAFYDNNYGLTTVVKGRNSHQLVGSQVIAIEKHQF
jgi:hypothetical protein